MKNNKNLLVVHLNEFNYDFLYNGSKKYKCKNIIQVIDNKKIKTITYDKKQNYNLDPWVQSVSINLGTSSKKHKILNLGQPLNYKALQIWDKLAKNKITCSVWGIMNSKFNFNKNLKLYFPDPWNYNDKPYPKKLENLYYLPNYYSKNYLENSKIKILLLAITFFLGCIRNNMFSFFIKNFYFISKIILKKGLKNFVLFFLFDLISINIFLEQIKKNKTKFSFIFLNSLAHYQHNNWDEKENEKYYFLLTDKICESIIKINKYYDSSILFNAFSQKKIKTEFIIRPLNPENFLKKLNINFKNIEQDMTNGAIINFSSKRDKDLAEKILKNFSIFGLNIFNVKTYSNRKIFYKFQIKAIVSKDEIISNKINKKNIKKYFQSEGNKIKHIYKNNKDDLDKLNFLLKFVKFIKCTGSHYNKGLLIYKNIELNKRLIKGKFFENHKIYNLILNHFYK